MKARKAGLAIGVFGALGVAAWSLAPAGCEASCDAAPTVAAPVALNFGAPAFEAQVATRLATGGDHVTTQLSFTSTPTADGGRALELAPERTLVQRDGQTRVHEGEARSVTQRAGSPLAIGKLSALIDLDPASRRSEVRVGDRWTAERIVPVGGRVRLPVQAVYTVRGFEEKDGRRLLRIDLETHGAQEAAPGVQLELRGEGYCLLDPSCADPPVELCLRYTTRAHGGPGDDAEAATEVRLTTRPLERS